MDEIVEDTAKKKNLLIFHMDWYNIWKDFSGWTGVVKFMSYEDGKWKVSGYYTK